MTIVVGNNEMFYESTIAVQALAVAKTLQRPIKRVVLSKHHHDMFVNTLIPGHQEGRAMLKNLQEHFKFELEVDKYAKESRIEFGLICGFIVLNPKNSQVASIYMRPEFTVENLVAKLRPSLKVEEGVSVKLVDPDGKEVEDLNKVPNGMVLELQTGLIT